MDKNTLQQQLSTGIPPNLVSELIGAFEEAKKNLFVGRLRPSEVEGGRFSEAAYRILEHLAFSKYTPIGNTLDTQAVSRSLANTPKDKLPDSIRIHIPRALRVVYDIRNNRDAAHLADNIDPNLQDATLVAGILDWVLAELIRLVHSVDADSAHRIIVNLITRQAPVIQEFDGFLKVLNPRLSPGDHLLVLLYHCGAEGASHSALDSWSRPEMRKNLSRTLNRLTNEKMWVHFDGAIYRITQTGEIEVERRQLFEPP